MSEIQEKDDIIEAARKEAQEIIENAKRETQSLLAKAEEMIEQKIREAVVAPAIETDVLRAEEPEVVTEPVSEPVEEIELESIAEEVTPEPVATSNEKMGDDAIAALFAKAQGVEEPEVVPEAEPVVEVESEPVTEQVESEPIVEEVTPEPVATSNEKMGDDAIAALLAKEQGKAESQVTEVGKGLKITSTLDVKPLVEEDQPTSEETIAETSNGDLQETEENQESLEGGADSEDGQVNETVETNEAQEIDSAEADITATLSPAVKSKIEKAEKLAKKAAKKKKPQKTKIAKDAPKRLTAKEKAELKLRKQEEKENRKLRKLEEKEAKREKRAEERSQQKKEKNAVKAEKKKEKADEAREKKLEKKNAGLEKEPKINPSVCVVLPTFNPDIYKLQELLQSINQQSYKNINIIICDDCSTETKLEDIQACVQQSVTELTFTVHQNDVQMGIDETFKKLTGMAQGEYIAYCQQNDLWMQGKIKRYIVENETNNHTLLCSDVFLIDGDGDEIADSITKIRKKHVFKQGEGLAPQLLFDNFVVAGTMMIKSEVAKMAGVVCPSMKYEHYMALYSATKGSIGFIGRPLTKCRLYDIVQEEVIESVEDRTSYITVKINQVLEWLKWLEQNFECDEETNASIQDAIFWTLARRENLRPRMKTVKEIWSFRYFDRKAAIFEIIIGKLPSKLAEKLFKLWR